jgi:hypothetical protein
MVRKGTFGSKRNYILMLGEIDMGFFGLILTGVTTGWLAGQFMTSYGPSLLDGF